MAPDSQITYFVEAEPADRENRQNSYYTALNWCVENSTGDILTVLSGDDERGSNMVLQDVSDEFEKRGSHFAFGLYGACEWINRKVNTSASSSHPSCLSRLTSF